MEGCSHCLDITCDLEEFCAVSTRNLSAFPSEVDHFQLTALSHARHPGEHRETLSGRPITLLRMLLNMLLFARAQVETGKIHTTMSTDHFAQHMTEG